jgi:hypothetical protein
VAEIASASYAVTGSYTVTGLTANTACYFAVSAVYADGESLPSAAVYGKTSEIFHELTIAPVPVLIAGDGSITVSWDPVPFADSYNVYCNTDPVLPGTPYRTGITGSSAAITGLINDTTYYVWVEAVNSIGTKTGEAVPGVPQLPSVQEYTVYSDAGFTQAVAGINASSTRGIYRITLLSNITANNVSFSATSVEKTIILKGDTSLRTISKTDNTDLFVVRSGNTLALENNLNLNSNAKAGTMVQIDKGGTLVMKAGSRIEDARSYAVSVSGAFEMSGGKISGSTASSSCVYVSGGTFKMSGGEISGNRAFDDGGGVYVSGGAFEMSGGEISGNSVSASLSRGGGVYVFYNSTFTMSGGKISGNTAEFGGGVYIYDSTFTMSGGEISGNTAGFGGGVYVGSATFIKNGGGVIYGSNESTALKNTAGRGNNWGHAVSVYEGSRKRNTTAGTDVALYSNISGSAGGWE